MYFKEIEEILFISQCDMIGGLTKTKGFAKTKMDSLHDFLIDFRRVSSMGVLFEVSENIP